MKCYSYNPLILLNLDMENEGGNNNEQPRSNIRARRNWSELEEEALLTILEEMVVAGNKGENGTFKPGTHEEVCKRMRNKIPRIAINAKQVVNKMKRWSSKLNEVVDMMNTGGFGWDDTRKCVTCDSSQVLSEYLEVFNLKFVECLKFLSILLFI